MHKFRNKYCTKSTRLQSWDYSNSAYYFVTICTKNKEKYFGKIADDKMILNKIGKIAEQFWLEIPSHFPFVILDEFILMPNHIHGILVFENNDCRDKALPCLYMDNVGKNRFQNQGKNTLSSVIGSFKSICTKTINKIQSEIFFAWQGCFYDRIIRTEEELNKVRNYIINNPLKWFEDENFIN